MSEAILDFPKQFEYKPAVENKRNFVKKNKFIVVGMGGSHLNGDMIQRLYPDFPVVVHQDYGLPNIPAQELKKSLIVCSSYSGNTEEVLSAYKEAQKKDLALAAISIGGKLIGYAKKDGVPYVQMPDTGIQPRSALGFSFMGLLKILGREKELREMSKLAKLLKPKPIEPKGKALAKRMKDRIPIIYSSRKNWTIAWNWKIKLNETGKVPAFYNVFPELNHNEMNGFDVTARSRHLSERFYFLILKDNSDHKKIQKRMKVVEKLYKDRNLGVETLELKGKTSAEKIFNSLILADWIAVYTAQLYGLESEQVPMVEEFKKLIA